MTQCQCPNPPGGTVTCGPLQTAVCSVTNGVVDARCINTPDVVAQCLKHGIEPHQLDALRADRQFHAYVRELLGPPDDIQEAEHRGLVETVIHALFDRREGFYKPSLAFGMSRHSLEYRGTAITFTVPHEVGEDPDRWVTNKVTAGRS